MTFRSFDIYIATLPNLGGSVQTGTRPVIIYDVFRYNYDSDKAQCCVRCLPLTTEVKNKLPVHYFLHKQDTDLYEDSTVLAEQMCTLEGYRLIRKVGSVRSVKHRFHIRRIVGIQLGICPVTYKYKYDFLSSVKDISKQLNKYNYLRGIAGVPQHLLDRMNRDMTILLNLLKENCKKHNIQLKPYLDDLYNDRLDFSVVA